ncbi:hypothetical protein [Dactylosporangium sp. CA-092794]|uniref:hypothetical protein n=1 Tax=Dactylosporangium sp. CA-092794 TaxID=3239929 RepID=UPI003D8CDDA2
MSPLLTGYAPTLPQRADPSRACSRSNRVSTRAARIGSMLHDRVAGCLVKVERGAVGEVLVDVA